MHAAPATVAPARRRRPTAVLGAAWTRARRNPLAVDLTFGTAMAAVTLVGAITESHPTSSLGGLRPGQHVPAPGSVAPYLLVAVSALALGWRRRHPQLVLAVSLGCIVAYTCLGFVNGAALLNPMCALYAVAVAVPPRRALVVSLLTMGALMGATAAFNPSAFGTTGGGFVMIPGEAAAALLLGLWVASHHAFAQRETEERARRAVDAERLRIARELHDVVAHTMATINVQAGVAAHVIDEQPEEAAKALVAIRQASKEGLRELRGILDVLRQADEGEPTAPAPRLAQLEALIDSTSRAGLPTTLTVTGRARPLSPTVDLAAYRIVQESLTNALRHAGPTTATVTLAYDGDELALEISDRGVGFAEPVPGRSDRVASHGGAGSGGGSGHGIAGMSERARAVGGSLHAGPLPEGGFGVRARLPIRPAA